MTSLTHTQAHRPANSRCLWFWFLHFPLVAWLSGSHWFFIPIVCLPAFFPRSTTVRALSYFPSDVSELLAILHLGTEPKYSSICLYCPHLAPDWFFSCLPADPLISQKQISVVHPPHTCPVVLSACCCPEHSLYFLPTSLLQPSSSLDSSSTSL